MSIFSRFYWKIKREQIKVLSGKFKKEVLKLCFAVVIAESVLVGVFYIASNHGILEHFKPKTIYINNAEAKNVAVNPINEPVKDEIEELKDFIWQKESTRGKNNYSKCEAIGKVNGIGYGIDGSGAYRCFESHEDEMKVLEGWIIDHKAQGMTRLEMLKHYTPSYTGV